MKRSLLLTPLLLLLAACGQSAEPVVPVPSSSAVNAPTTTTITASPTETTTVVVEPPAEPSPVADEPYVIECLEGTPGPALWSDGTTRASDWCFETMGGSAYLDAERASGASPAAQPPAAPTGTTSTRGYSCAGDDGCRWPDGSPVAGADRCGVMCGEAPTSGEMQLKNGCEGGYITQPGLCDDPWWK